MERDKYGRFVKQHGMSSSRLYHIWEGMKGRCDRKSCNGYEDYGGKGITYCDKWETFAVFMKIWEMNIKMVCLWNE